MKRILFILSMAIMCWSCGSSSSESKTVGGEDLLNGLIQKKFEDKAGTNGMISNVMFGSKKQPIRFYMTQSGDLDEMRQKLAPLLDFIANESGLYFELYIPESYDEMIQAFATDQAHFALMNSLSFVKVKESYEAYAELKTIRFHTSSYFGQIIARTELGIESVEELAGMTMAFTDTSSASGYLYPSNMLIAKGVVPGQVVFAGSHDEVVRMIYTGQADAGATYYAAPDKEGRIRDARARLQDEFEDVKDKVSVVTVTRPIPNDPIVFSRTMNKKLAYQICNVLVKFMSTPEAKSSLGALYGIDGFVRSSPDDYNDLREAMIMKDSLTSRSLPTS